MGYEVIPGSNTIMLMVNGYGSKSKSGLIVDIGLEVWIRSHFILLYLPHSSASLQGASSVKHEWR